MWIPHCKPGLNFPKLKTRFWQGHQGLQSIVLTNTRVGCSFVRDTSTALRRPLAVFEVRVHGKKEREWGESYAGKERTGGTWKAWTLATRVGLGVRKSMQPAKIEWWGVGAVICLEQGADCLHVVQLMPLHPKTPSSLAALKSWLVLPFWYWLTQANLERGHCTGAYPAENQQQSILNSFYNFHDQHKCQTISITCYVKTSEQQQRPSAL